MTLLLIETSIAAPPERCIELCLTIETHVGFPGSRETAVDGVRSGVMGLGDFVTWESRRFGLRQRMTSKITELDAPHCFVDEMLRGPFKRWRHVHRFESVPSGTLMTDEIDYAVPFGPIGWIADRVFVRRYMTRLLRNMNSHIRELAEGSAEKEGER